MQTTAQKAHTSTQTALGVQGFVPPHVPADLVQPFSFIDAPGITACPFAAIKTLHDGPRVFWNPANHRFGGSWVLTRAEDIRFVLSRTDLFTNKDETGYSKLLGEDWPLIPLEVDPPLHTDFRKLLNPLVSPPVVEKMTPGVTARCVELIDGLRDKGECEFISSFSKPFPVSIFMQLMGLPAEQMDTFLSWEYDLFHGRTLDQRRKAGEAIKVYLLDLAEARRQKPENDLASAVVAGEVDGRPLTEIEVLGVLYLLFIGGLDTVASTLGFIFKYLAENPKHQQMLRENPQMIDRKVEEFLRRFSVVTAHRQCNVDVEVGGVQMKAGDWVTVNSALGSLDDTEFENPMDLDLDRKGIRHFAFNFGHHFCMGSHLARRELIIAIREWLARMPPFRLKAGAPFKTHGGSVFGVEHLELEWDL